MSVKLEVIAKCGGLAYVVVQLQLQGATPRSASPRAVILPVYTDARGDVVLKIRSANLAVAAGLAACVPDGIAMKSILPSPSRET